LLLRNCNGSIPEEVVKQAFAKANARCQCEREGYAHSTFACFKQIEWKNGGNGMERSEWEAHYIVSPEEGGKPTVKNCEILCWDCYTKTLQSQ
jgi:hypothetical protein